MAEKKVTVKTISRDTIVKLEVSGIMYENIQAFLQWMTTRVDDPKAVARIIGELGQREPETEYEFHLMTLFHLIHDIEKAAIDQDLTKEEEIILPEDDPES